MIETYATRLSKLLEQNYEDYQNKLGIHWKEKRIDSLFSSFLDICIKFLSSVLSIPSLLNCVAEVKRYWSSKIKEYDTIPPNKKTTLSEILRT